MVKPSQLYHRATSWDHRSGASDTAYIKPGILCASPRPTGLGVQTSPVSLDLSQKAKQSFKMFMDMILEARGGGGREDALISMAPEPR